MERTIVVFDTDSARSSLLAEELHSCLHGTNADIHVVRDISVLNRSVTNGEVDILFFDVRAVLPGCGGVDEICELALRRTRAQIVYTGVSESELTRLSSAEHVLLLSPKMTSADVEFALETALDMYERRLEKPFVVKTRSSSRIVFPGRVSFAESNLRKIRIHVGGDAIEAYGKLSRLMHALPDRFVQCHKSFVVNMGFVEKLSKEHLVLVTGELIPVSQKRRKITREAFEKYVGRVL